MREIAGLRSDDARLGAVGVVQELIGLMRADVGENAAETRLIPEPFRA